MIEIQERNSFYIKEKCALNKKMSFCMQLRRVIPLPFSHCSFSWKKPLYKISVSKVRSDQNKKGESPIQYMYICMIQWIHVHIENSQSMPTIFSFRFVRHTALQTARGFPPGSEILSERQFIVIPVNITSLSSSNIFLN